MGWNDFLQRYWQKHPIIIKPEFRDFVYPLSPNELPGLAMEAEVDNELVSHDDVWQFSHGPFGTKQPSGCKSISGSMVIS